MSGVQVTTRRETAPVVAAASAVDRLSLYLQRLPLHLVIIILCAFWIVPTIGMVIISASLKAISSEVLEAARIDGANEFRIVQLVVTPLLWPTITVVGTTMIINALKTFDIVYVLTAGAYDTDVIATQMFNQLSNAHYGRAAAVGVVLFLAIVPLLIVNIRRFQQQEEQR